MGVYCTYAHKSMTQGGTQVCGEAQEGNWKQSRIVSLVCERPNSNPQSCDNDDRPSSTDKLPHCEQPNERALAAGAHAAKAQTEEPSERGHGSQGGSTTSWTSQCVRCCSALTQHSVSSSSLQRSSRKAWKKSVF